MTSFSTFIFIAQQLLLVLVLSSPIDWNGEFSNIAYSGSLVVCVSQVGEVFIGQALISERSYMRGIIHSNDSWVGDYWRAGGGIQGSFRLRLVDGGSSLATYSGEMSRTNGRTARIYGFQTNYSKPAPDLCFQTENSLLTPEPVTNFDFVGNWVGWEILNSPSSSEPEGLEATYTVVPSQVAAGTAEGSIYLPQIWGFQWTDAVTATTNATVGSSGIGLAVARSTDAFHLLMIPTQNGELIYSGLRRCLVYRHGGTIAASGDGSDDSGELSTGLTVIISVLLALCLVSLCCCYAGYCQCSLALCSYKNKDEEIQRSSRPPSLPTVPPTAGTGLGPTVTRVNNAPDTDSSGGILGAMSRAATSTVAGIAGVFAVRNTDTEVGGDQAPCPTKGNSLTAENCT